MRINQLTKRDSHVSFVRKGALTLLTSGLALVVFGSVANAQNGDAPAMPMQASSHQPTTVDYRIGPQDVVSITVGNAPEFSGRFRVSDSGMIVIAGIPPVKADGLTSSELSQAVRQALLDAKQMRDPMVNTFIEEFRGRTVTVLGAVSKPGVYALQKKSTVLDALSLAGGSLQNAGAVVTVVLGSASAEATGQKEGSVVYVNMARLMKGEDATTNIEVRNGDVVSVSNAQVVYVIGAVVKPGGYVMQDPQSGVTAVQAVAMAEGFNGVASTHKGVIVRQSASDHTRQEIPVDVGLMMQGKETDVVLAPNDILFIPDSMGKKTLKVLGDVAMATVNGIAIYGIGYRIGTRP